MRILISVSDHSGLVEFLTSLLLSSLGDQIDIVATSETARHLRTADIPHTTVEQVTGQAEILNSRGALFHPRIIGGIVADFQNDLHRAQLARQHIERFDLIIANMAVDPEIDEFDHGRFSLINMAASNSESVTVIVNPTDYREVKDDIFAIGEVTDMTRLRLATTALYIASQWISREARRLRHQVEAKEKAMAAMMAEAPIIPTVPITAFEMP